jgi:hypothetical protein
MKVRVCSGWNPNGRVQYGETFLRTFDKRWPADVELQVYVEQPHKMPRDACRDLFSIPKAREFYDTYKDSKMANGRVAQPCWKPAEVRRGYSFKTDAFKFFKQILIPPAAAIGLEDGDFLVWLDGDVVTTADIPRDFIPKLLGKTGEVCFLNREPQHSEIGFWAVRINQKTRKFLSAMADYYTSGGVFGLTEWHSAFVWDRARERCDLEEVRLCKPNRRGHVFPKSPVGDYLRHDKGPRKGTAQ